MDVKSAPRIANVCVFCGSASGADPAFERAAVTLGRALAAADAGLVYGGGGHGLMGTLSRAVLDAGGRVTGIIPDFLTAYAAPARERQDHIVVPDMHARKLAMCERADAFVALPGGIGTLEELAEQLTWVRLGRHSKPIVIANVNGFWRPLLALLDHMRENRFFGPPLDVRYLVAERAEDILPMLERMATEVGKPGSRWNSWPLPRLEFG